MRVHSITIRNYGPFEVLEEVRLGLLATIVGQNDVGKSNILRALRLFFEERPKIEESDVYNGAGPNDDVVIEVAFTDLPDAIELEDGVETSFQDEMLVDANGCLRIRKIFPRSNLTKPHISLIVQDFVDDSFASLPILKEKDLIERCALCGIEVTKSGRGITNKSKREALRAKARDNDTPLGERELALTTRDELWKKIVSILPEFILFETDTRLGIAETSFQSQFRPIVKTAVEEPEVIEVSESFTDLISRFLQAEIDKIFSKFQRYTDAFTDLTAKAEFSWDKAVTLQVVGKDQFGVETSLDRRGSGIRRLLMVAFFQYLAERGRSSRGDFIFAVEEPENCLHPRLQRELVRSFQQLADEGYQIVVTSHSPVFAGASPIEDLVLVVRKGGVAKAVQVPDLDLSDIADELGVEPSDQITGYNACIFVEGPSDVEFWRNVARKFKEGGYINADFDDRRVGFILCGGETLKYWIDQRAMGRLNRRFGVIVDSDRKSSQHNIPQRKLNWKQKCEQEGGVFFILRKREIENYIHPDAISRSGRSYQQYDDFTDMKKLFGDNVYKLIEDMTCKEILEMDRYTEDGVEHHELLEIVQEFLRLAENQ